MRGDDNDDDNDDDDNDDDNQTNSSKSARGHQTPVRYHHVFLPRSAVRYS